jgi:integrase-like protein
MEELKMETTQENPAIAEKGRKRGQNGLGSTYKHNGSWWMDVRIRGERHREKLGPIKLLEKRQADKIKEARITAIMMPKAPEASPVKGTMPFSEFAEKFVVWACDTKRSWERCRGKAPAKTPFAYASHFFGQIPLKDINTELVEKFQAHLQLEEVGARRLKKASVNRYVALLRHSFYWAINNGYMGDSNPVAELTTIMLKEARPTTRVLEPVEDKKCSKRCRTGCV